MTDIKDITNYYVWDKESDRVRSTDLKTFARQYEKPGDRILKHTKVGEVLISTVFLGLDHRFGSEDGDDPIVFETMIFGGDHDQYQERYTTGKQAMIGHNKAVAIVKGD